MSTKWNPLSCSDLNLQKGVKIIAIVDLTFAIILIFCELTTLRAKYSGENEPNSVIINGTATEPTHDAIANTPSSTHMWIAAATFLISAIFIGVEFWLFRLLMRASKNVNIIHDFIGCVTKVPVNFGFGQG